MCVYIYIYIRSQHLRLQKKFGKKDSVKGNRKSLTDVFWLCSKTSICYNAQALLLVLCLFCQRITLTGGTADILINLTLFYVELKGNVDKSC